MPEIILQTLYERKRPYLEHFWSQWETFSLKKQIVLLDIYPSRETDTGLVKSWQLAQSVQKSNVRYQNPEELKETLGKEIRRGDIVFFMGAGDIDKLAKKLTKQF